MYNNQRRIKWTKELANKITELHNAGMSVQEVASKCNMEFIQVRNALNRINLMQGYYERLPGNDSGMVVPTLSCVDNSIMPVFDSPLEQSGDCLILPDTEFPFHHAEFINRCLDLAFTLGVKNCCIAGDAMHFNSVSHWEANWKATTKNPEISDAAHARLIDLLPNLPSSAQDKLLEVVEAFEIKADSDVGSEVKLARKAFEQLAEVFDDVVYVIGNHDGRLLSALNSPMFADQLKQFAIGENPKYRIDSYYYSILHTEAGDYRITHPAAAAQNTAVSIATQFHQHVIMGHSHNFSKTIDPSGKYWAIQAGCCVDESRLAYAAQRDRGAKRHVLGAILVYDGYPYDLSIYTKWEGLKRMIHTRDAFIKE